MEKISFKDLSTEMSKHRVTILVCMVVSLLCGLFLYKIKPNEYTSKVQFLLTSPSEDSQQSRLGSLASIAGINLGVETTGIPSSAYEYVLESSSFLLDVIDEKIVFEGDTILIGNYLTQRMTMGLKNQLLSLSSSKGKVKAEALTPDNITVPQSQSSPIDTVPILQLSGKSGMSVNILRNSMEFVKEEAKPIITVSVTLQDPEASARVARVLIEKLEEYINRYSQDNKEDNTLFLSREVEKAQDRLYQTQLALARAKDRNVNANMAIVNVEIERRNLDLSQAQKTYNDLVLQLENAKVQVEKTTPLFVVIEPPNMLNIDFPTAPRLVIYVVLSLFVGIFISLIFIFGKAFYKRNS